MTLMTLTVQTVHGPKAVPATVCGPLAVHVAVGVAGWSISHTASGLNILSRLTMKSVALQLAHYLCTRTDWSRPVIPPEELASIRALLPAVPRRLIRKYSSTTKSKTRGPPGSDKASTEEAHHLPCKKGRRP
jgi:hypothetical protein